MGQIASSTGGDDLNRILALLLGQDPSGQQGNVPGMPSAPAPKQPTDPRLEARKKLNIVNRALYGNPQGFGLQTRTSPNSPFANKQSFDSIGSRTAKDFNIPGNLIRNASKPAVKRQRGTGPVRASESE